MKRPLFSVLIIFVAGMLFGIAVSLLYPTLTQAPGATAADVTATPEITVPDDTDEDTEDTSGTRSSNERTATAGDNTAAVTRAIEEGFAEAQIDVLHEIYSPDYVGHLAPTSDFATIDLTDLTELVDLFTTAVSDLEVETAFVIGEGDIVASRWTLRGNFTNEFYDTPPTGEAIELEVTAFHRFDEEGMIVEEWVSYDNAWLSQQLGTSSSD